MNELERYKKALEVVMQELRGMGLDYAPMVEHIHRKVDAALNPPPVYEEVEITRWECDVCGKVYKHDIIPELPCGDGCDSKSYTLLTGTRRVEKPQPRERSAEGKVYGAGVNSNNVVFVTGENIPVGTPVKVIWQE